MNGALVFGFVLPVRYAAHLVWNVAASWMWTWPSAFLPAFTPSAISGLKNGLASSAVSTSAPVLCPTFVTASSAGFGSRARIRLTAWLPYPRASATCAAALRLSRAPFGSAGS